MLAHELHVRTVPRRVVGEITRSAVGATIGRMPTIDVLRPLTEAELPILDHGRLNAAEASEFDFHGFRTAHGKRAAFAENGLLAEDGGVLAVVDGGGEAVGTVSWRRVTTGAVCFTWNIGISLRASAQGKGLGTAAQRALVDYLFDYTQAYRVEAHTETENIAEQRALEKAGFTREGVVRGAAFRAGRWRDMAAYSVLRTEYRPDR